jgi:site-specific DNA-cytosine methylase
MDVAIAALGNSGYNTSLSVIDCRNFGMTQMRKCAILIAWNTGKDLHFSLPSESPKTIRQAIDDISDSAHNHDHLACQATGIQGLIATHISPGQTN